MKWLVPVLAVWGPLAAGAAVLPSDCPFELLAPDTGGGAGGASVLSPRVSEIVTTAGPNAPLKLLFQRHAAYLNDPAAAAALDRRARLWGSRLFEGWTPDVAKADPKEHDLAVAKFLIAARGNIKDMAWEAAVNGRAAMEAMGAKPERFSNLVPPDTTAQVLRRALDQSLVKDAVLDNQIELATGHRLKEVLENPEILKIYSDEIAATLCTALEKAIKNFGASREKSAAAIELLKTLRAPLRSGELAFSLSGRNLDSLKAGDEAGDCTQCGADNHWTQGAWNTTFENNELRVTVGGKFFARLLMIAGEANGKPALYVHAVEFNPQVRKEQTANPAAAVRNKAHFQATLEFLKAHAKNAGFQTIAVTDISNSSDYSKALRDVLSPTEKTSVPFSLLNPLSSAHALQKTARGGEVEKKVDIYLQGWGGSTSFRADLTAKSGNTPKARPVNIGGRNINAHQVEQASHVFWDFYRQQGEQRTRQMAHILRRLAVFGLDEDNEKVSKKEVAKNYRKLQEDVAVVLAESPDLQAAVDELSLRQSQLGDVFGDRLRLYTDRFLMKARKSLSHDTTRQALQSLLLRYPNAFIPGVTEKQGDVQLLIDHLGPAFKETLRSKLSQLDIPTETAEWLAVHPVELEAFYHSLRRRNERTAQTLSSNLTAFEIPLN